MKLQVVREGDLSTKTLEDILDIFVRSKTTGTQLRVETRLVTALIRELLRMRKETCPVCENIEEADQSLQEQDTLPKIEVQEFILTESLLEGPLQPSNSEIKIQPEVETKSMSPADEPAEDPAIIAGAPKTINKKPLRGTLSLRPKENNPFRFWIIFGLLIFNISWIAALIIFLF